MKKPIPFGKYYLLERINVGGMAEVFKAKATGVEGFERIVAVKRILPSIAEDEEFIAMFIDEAKIAVQLTHANIAQIFDLGRVDDSFFIAMEYVPGKDLRTIFNRARNRGEPLSMPLVVYVIMKVCEGLDYAHNKSDSAGSPLHLVHRDVSPQNILISYDGEVKIIDFGIAKAAGKASKTQAGILKGKFGYMSPEQVQGLELDRRSDVFGLGIVLYELLTGERLFLGESDFSTLEKVRNVEIMPPSTYNRRIPEELEQIVLRALARDREDRYQTCMQLHDELQAFMYASGNLFARKDLSHYTKNVFAEDLEKESAGFDASMESAEGDSDSLAAFGDLDPISTVSALSELPSQPPPRPMPERGAQAAHMAQTSAERPKSTLLGMPAAELTGAGASGSMPPRVPSMPPRVPSMPPRVPSMPPRVPSMPPSRPPSSTSLAATPPVGSGGPALDMDWDDEELSTQIYDKPEDLQAAIDGVPGPQFRHAGMSGSAPPPEPIHAGQSTLTGAPSPFEAYGHPSSEPRYDEGSHSLRPSLLNSMGRQPVVVALVAVVALVGLVAGGLALFGSKSKGALQLQTQPTDAVVKLNDKPVPGIASPFVITNVTPGVTHVIEVSKEGYRPWSAQIEVESGQSLQLPAVVLEPISQGTGFALDSVPSGAEVFVNGQKVEGRTPIRVADLAPGTHVIRLEHGPKHAPWQTQIQVAAKQIVELTPAELKLAKVEVAFTSAPKGAEVTLLRGTERTALGATPLQKEVDLTGGTWMVEVAKSGFVTKKEALDVKAGESDASFHVTLERDANAAVAAAPPVQRRASKRSRTNFAPKAQSSSSPAAAGGKGTLRVNTRPWSQVFVDGRLIGNTPQMGISLPAGRYTLTLVNSEFNVRKNLQVTIRPGQTETQIVNLMP